jgi:hypothetical protein
VCIPIQKVWHGANAALAGKKLRDDNQVVADVLQHFRADDHFMIDLRVKLGRSRVAKYKPCSGGIFLRQG